MLWIKYLIKKLPLIIIFLVMVALYLINFLLWHFPLTAFYDSTSLILIVFLLYLFAAYFPWRRDDEKVRNLNKQKEELTTKLEDEQLSNKQFYDVIKIWSHQMKVPLSAIDLMSQTEISKEDLKNQVFALENYLNILLEYERINHLSTDFRFEKAKVSDLARDLVRKYSSFFIQKNLSVNFEVEEEWELITDKRWLSLALEQLINNAVKYTQTGGLTIKIKKGMISIADTGIGILPEDLPRLFDHGFTGYNGRIQQKSTGLGLYLSKMVLDKLDFDLLIESEVEAGTCVTIKTKAKK